MRVEKINSNYYIQNKNTNYKTSPSKTDYISFTGEKENLKPSFIQKIASFFEAENLTPEKETSNEIEEVVGHVQDEVRQSVKNAKWERAILHDLIKIGEYGKFEGYIPVNKKSGEKLKFGEFDENGRPREMVVVNTKNGAFKTVCAYSLFDGENAFQKRDYSFEGAVVSSDYINGKLLYLRQTNNEDKSICEIIPSRNGFYYFCGKKDEFDKPTEIIFEADISYDKDKLSTVNLTEDDGTLKHYYFDNQKRIWVEK
mgnify:CR=1 FL=1